MKNDFYLTQLAVRAILENPYDRKWTLQGLGMLRTYLSEDVRLHIWHNDHVDTDASQLHTHPWDFESLVICGEMRDFMYKHEEADIGKPCWRHKILCGEGGGPVGERESCSLIFDKGLNIPAGHHYYHSAEQIHRSEFVNGTVTLVRRYFKEDVDHAYVYWPGDETWGTAEPRPAKMDEIQLCINEALGILPADLDYSNQ